MKKEGRKMQEINVRDVQVKSGDDSIFGRLYTPASGDDLPVVIISHGYNGRHLDWVNEGTFLAEHGIAAFAFDFCGGSMRSASTGNTTDMTIGTETENLLSVYAEISSMPFIDPDRVFLMGGSMGGFVSALAAERLNDKVRALVLYFPALCIPDNWRDKYPDDKQIPEVIDFWDMEIGKGYVKEVKRIRTFDVLGAYPNPVLIFHGTEDAVVPISYSQEAAKAYSNARLRVLPGEGHGFSVDAGENVIKEVLDFVKQNCQP